MLRSLMISLAMLAIPALAHADEPGRGRPPQRIRNVTLTQGQACPKAGPDEIVVCQKLEDPYRIPKSLRDEPKTDVTSTAWAVKVDRAMEDNRKILPGSCSPIGTNGQSGCAQKAAEEWAAERRARANGQPVDPQ